MADERLVVDETEVFTGRLDRLSKANQLLVADSIIASNRLAQKPETLVRSFLDGRLYVRFWLSRRILLAATGYKKPNPAVRHAILATWTSRRERADFRLLAPEATCLRLVRNVAAERVVEKGWTFNRGEREPFRALNARVLEEVVALGYGVWRVFTLVVESNRDGRRFTEKTGFVPLLTVPSPFSAHSLILHGLGVAGEAVGGAGGGDREP